MNGTLFDRIGGEDAVTDAVTLFFRKVLRDDRIARFFDHLDIDAQAKYYRDFFTEAFGGPTVSQDAPLDEIHDEMVDRGLGDFHFDVFLELLGESLDELGVAASLINEVTGITESSRDRVLGRTTVAAAVDGSSADGAA